MVVCYFPSLSQHAWPSRLHNVLQVARCLEHGLLVAQDAAAAFRRYQHAAGMGSAEAALRCGIHFFDGTAPGGALVL